MYCNQCQEAARGIACTSVGVCGKKDALSNQMDVLLYALKGISMYAQELRKEGKSVDRKVSTFITEGLFMTITNANFDEKVIVANIIEGQRIREELRKQLGRTLSGREATFEASTIEEIREIEKEAAYDSIENEDVRALRSLIIFGLILLFNRYIDKMEKR